MEEYIKVWIKTKQKSGSPKKSLVGRPTDLFFIKRQKRGRVPNLDSLKKEPWNENLAKKRKKTRKIELRQAPSVCDTQTLK
jgi:hypothetical protein